MSRLLNPFGFLKSVVNIVLEVCVFWQLRLYAWWFEKAPQDALLENLGEARLFEEWEAAAFQLDEVLGYDLWRQNPASKSYDFRLIYSRLQAIISAREDDDILTLVSLLRSGLVRNLGNITTPRLFSRAYAGTKLLIEDYITQVALAVDYVTSYPTSASLANGLTLQAKLDVLHDTRQAFGRSALVLQGGSIFGLCHLGVVKALHLRGLLPRIIAGTATGALMAALVGVHTEDELLAFLSGDGIDLSAFAQGEGAQEQRDGNGVDGNREEGSVGVRGWVDLKTLKTRVKRFLKEGHFLDVGVLEQCVRANVGDLTFEEAYSRTKRVLNITVSAEGGGVPNVLNYLTAPNVLIWSAALASNTTTSSLFRPVTLLCKSESGEIHPWSTAEHATFHPWTHTAYSERESPLARIAELFNVNHFIVSQARPYIVPFLRSELHHPPPPRRHAFRFLTRLIPLPPMMIPRLVVMELHHRLHQLDNLSLLPPSIRRFLLDENVPGASLTLVPEISARDFLRLVENPSREAVEHWILRGERSVWPAVGALKVRCAVEVELDRGYQLVRRRKPFDKNGGSAVERVVKETNQGGKRKERAMSLGEHG
ncbi:hypothetical protein P152DRAFT_439849 [Eremomyces bilateralis CBS 781.70]|uniref:PNPLA domain-containing protein n=1 Tax=Eremomyces bilateralis CBS 781.70 TaxID=1392243 RepID=A0A6G1FXD4_9PEZI|nr:uncharacterized protein P152DRAFT_439849 [Eremomyces bilateralis CBS 781.70]KAF1810341.1 hypothetical protein P152DRAFT_439849 [Eremomyces bilateralis CBS 781.70]